MVSRDIINTWSKILYGNIKQLPGIYKISFETSTDTYVGTSLNIRRRLQAHMVDFRKGKNSPKLQEAWNILGESLMRFEVIEYVDDPVKIYEREQYYIDTLKPTLNQLTMKEAKKKFLIRSGVLEPSKPKAPRIYGPKTFSVETRRRMSESAKKRVKRLGMQHVTEAAAKVNAEKRHRPDEVKEKISLTKLQKYASGEYTHHLSFQRDEEGKFTKQNPSG